MLGMNTKTIKEITGHKKDAVFNKYVKISEDFKKLEMERTWNNIPDLKKKSEAPKNWTVEETVEEIVKAMLNCKKAGLSNRMIPIKEGLGIDRFQTIEFGKFSLSYGQTFNVFRGAVTLNPRKRISC